MDTPAHKRPLFNREEKEKGNAIAAFVLIVPLVILVLFAVISLIYMLHIRFAVEDAAFEGAKAASLAGGDSIRAEAKTRDALTRSFHKEYCSQPDITTRALSETDIEVSLRCPSQRNPWFGVPIPEMTVNAYAHIE